METTPLEMMKSYVNSQKFSNTTEVMAAMKEMFKEVLQQVLEGELDEELGYQRSVLVKQNCNRASKNHADLIV